ncbi:hypothetical protein EGI22_13570 [Lacihabitans sp. LS3-19]|nr:hypothetical protein [Lacihabitans sp. LS3-19]
MENVMILLVVFFLISIVLLVNHILNISKFNDRRNYKISNEEIKLKFKELNRISIKMKVPN